MATEAGRAAALRNIGECDDRIREMRAGKIPIFFRDVEREIRHQLRTREGDTS
jgi:hypothetical protein